MGGEKMVMDPIVEFVLKNKHHQINKCNEFAKQKHILPKWWFYGDLPW